MITSSQNPKIQRVKALLARPRERREQGAFVVEGVRLAEEALASGWPPELVLFSAETSPRGHDLVQKFAQAGVEVEQAAESVMQALSATETSQGILAVLPARELPLPEKLDFVVIADSLRDPGNLGTLLRTAAAAGAQAVFLGPGTADALAPKVLRAAMGAHFRLPIYALGWEQIRALTQEGSKGERLHVYLAEAEGGQPYWQSDLRRPVALLIGGEAEGATPAGRALADDLLHIPMPGESESLNAAVAAGILLFEVVRQRRSPASS